MCKAWISGEETRFRDAVGCMPATSLGIATSLRRVTKWPRPRGPSLLAGPARRRQLASLLHPSHNGQPEASLKTYVEELTRAAPEESTWRWTESLLRACAPSPEDPQAAPHEPLASAPPQYSVQPGCLRLQQSGASRLVGK